MMAFTDRVCVPAHVMVRILDNEAVFLNLETERYIGLDPTGTRMWQLLTAAPAIRAAFDQLLDEYDVTPELLQSDLAQFLSQLIDNGLLRVVSSDVEAAAAAI
jgi:hypothetical protein